MKKSLKLIVVGLVALFMFGGCGNDKMSEEERQEAFENVKEAPPYDGCYLRLSNGKFIEMTKLEARETYIKGTSWNNFMDSSRKAFYVIKKGNIVKINQSELVGIAWRDKQVSILKDEVSIHPLEVKTGADYILRDNVSSVFGPGKNIDLKRKSVGNDTYYFQPRQALPAGEYVVRLDNIFYLFSVGLSKKSEQEIYQTNTNDTFQKNVQKIENRANNALQTKSNKKTILDAPVMYGGYADTTLCQKDDTIVFSCDIKQKKLAVCQKQDGKTVYRYGTPENVELTIDSPPFYSHEHYIRANVAAHLRFHNKGYNYIIYETEFFEYENNPNDDTGKYVQRNGVYVVKNDKLLANLECNNINTNALGIGNQKNKFKQEEFIRY